VNIKSRKFYFASICLIVFINLVLNLISYVNDLFNSYYFLLFIIINIIIIIGLNFIYKKHIIKNEFYIIKDFFDKSSNPMIFSQGLKIHFMNTSCSNLFNIKNFKNLLLSDLFKDLDCSIISSLSAKQKPSIFISDFNNIHSSYLIMPSEIKIQNENYCKLNIYPFENLFSIFDMKKNPLIFNVIDNLDSSILILNGNRTITYFNKSSSQLLNLNMDQDLNFNDIIQNYSNNIKLLEGLSNAYQGEQVQSVDYENIRIKDVLLTLKYKIFPINVDSNIIGVSVVFNIKSNYTKALEKNSISNVLQEHSDFGIYEYDKENNLVELSKGASYLLYSEFENKTVSSEDFFSVLDKKNFIENYESTTISKDPYIEKFNTLTKARRFHNDNYFKILGIIQDRSNSGFIGDYGYILDITDYYIPKVSDIASASMEKLSDEVILTDLSGSLIYANNKAKETFNINDNFICCYYNKHPDINKDWWFHKLIPNLSNYNSFSTIISFNNHKKYIQFKHYMVKVNKKQYIYIIGRDVTENRIFQKELKLISNYDQLTQIFNRRGIYDNMSIMFSQSKFAVAILDLDNFKPVNDTYGHLAGDIVIATFAKRLKNSAPDNSLVGRLSGDEFIVIIPEYGNLKDLEAIMEKIHESVTNKYIISQGVCTIGASIGISIYPENGKSRNELFKKADEAMYSVKKSGKNSYLIYSNLL